MMGVLRAGLAAIGLARYRPKNRRPHPADPQPPGKLRGYCRGARRSVRCRRPFASGSSKRPRSGSATFDPRRVVDLPRMRRALLAAAMRAAVFVVAWIMLSDRLTTAIARVFRPWADIPPASGVVYTVKPGNARCFAAMRSNSPSHVQGRAPTACNWRSSPNDGRLAAAIRPAPPPATPLDVLAPRASRPPSTIASRGGGTWTLPFHITMVDRPKLVSLQATLHYPKYFGPTEPRPNPPQVADIAGPEQSEVEIAVGVEGDVARGEIRLFQSPAGRRAKLVQTEALPMQPAAKARGPAASRCCTTASTACTSRIELKAANQTMKEGKLTAIVDRPPQILLERPAGDLTLPRRRPVPMVGLGLRRLCPGRGPHRRAQGRRRSADASPR